MLENREFPPFSKHTFRFPSLENGLNAIVEFLTTIQVHSLLSSIVDF